MQPDLLYTPAEYLALDAGSERKFEFVDGHVYAMAGAEPEHNQLVTNAVTELNNRLRPRGCRVAASDQRVQAGARYVYPDVVVVCDAPVYTDERPRSLVNPGLLVEVSSSSTVQKDRGWKLDTYLGLSSLQEYWIVASEEVWVLQYVRTEPAGTSHGEAGVEAWTLRILSGLDVAVASASFDVEIPIRDLYALVF